jgi:hypothetical protein
VEGGLNDSALFRLLHLACPPIIGFMYSRLETERFSRASVEWTVGSMLRPTSSGEGSIVTGIVARSAGWNSFKLTLFWKPHSR